MAAAGSQIWNARRGLVSMSPNDPSGHQRQPHTDCLEVVSIAAAVARNGCNTESPKASCPNERGHHEPQAPTPSKAAHTRANWYCPNRADTVARFMSKPT